MLLCGLSSEEKSLGGTELCATSHQSIRLAPKRHDHLGGEKKMKRRRLHGGMKHGLNVTYFVRRVDGRIEGPFRARNLTVNAGLNAARQQLHNPAYALATTVAQYIAVTTDSTTPSSSDTTLASEQTTNGLARVAGTYSSLGGTGAWQQQITFTYTGGTAITIAKSAMFDAASSGNMYYEVLLSPSATLNDGDALVLTWQGTEQAA